MKKLLIIGLIMILLTGCNKGKSINETASSGDDKLVIVTTLFPQYDFARQIAGDLAEVILILPPGVESHSYEPTPQDIVTIQEADLFVYTGDMMEPWAKKVLSSIQSDSLIIVDASKGVELLQHEHDENEIEHEDEHEDEHEGEDNATHEEGEVDPHIWLDPNNAMIMVDNILEALIAKDPTHSELFMKNASAYQEELQKLDQEFVELFKHVDYNEIIYGGHFAFGYFAHRYGLTHVSPYVGFSPDAEPTPQRIAELIDLMNESGQTVIYFEELVDPKVAKVIAEETGAEMLLLNGAHNITKKELENGATYCSIMRENIEQLKIGLGYNE